MISPAQHPNASVAMIAGLLVGQVIWVLGYWHVTIPESIQSGWTTLTIAALLYLGKRDRARRTASTKPVKARRRRSTVRRIRRPASPSPGS